MGPRRFPDVKNFKALNSALGDVVGFTSMKTGAPRPVFLAQRWAQHRSTLGKHEIT